MSNNHTTATVESIPDCDLCKMNTFDPLKVPAAYDGKTTLGSWAYMCKAHFHDVGIGLGLGKGQRLLLHSEKE